MGYEITAILIDEQRVRAFYGCKDPTAIDTICDRFADRLAREPDLRDGLRGLAFAEAHFRDPTNAPLYRYALGLVCEHLGERLSATIRLDARGLTKAKELGRLLAPGLIPMPISREGDFPVVGFLSAQQIGRKLGSLTDEQLADPDERAPTWLVWPKALEAERATYVAWLQRAAQAKRDLVAFYH
jgi:hypothetical protein